MTIMGLPQDFELLDPEDSINHICQNVPYYTAKDMATEVKAAIEGKRNMEKASFMLQDNLAKNIREKVSNASIMDFM
jgi:predicted AAA+ superfamily ATPase